MKNQIVDLDYKTKGFGYHQHHSLLVSTDFGNERGMHFFFLLSPEEMGMLFLFFFS